MYTYSEHADDKKISTPALSNCQLFTIRSEIIPIIYFFNINYLFMSCTYIVAFVEFE